MRVTLNPTKTFHNPVKESLKLVDLRILEQVEGNHPELEAALSQLVSAGGKRVRPIVTLLTGGMLGADDDRIITLAAAIEMLHTATLVHDDLIDGALLRRGMSTLNSEWTPAATVLTGDFVFARAAKLAAETNSVPVMHLFAETLNTIVNGEINQLFSNRGSCSREEYYRQICAKTASMFELATGAAAMLCPVNDDTVAAARRFGYEFGMAFQIIDDVLDFTGEQATVGKPVASDLRQGLITLPTLYFLEGCPEDPDFEMVIRRNGHDERRMNRLITSIRESGAVEKSMKDAVNFVQSGLYILSELPNTSERQALVQLANYSIRREI